MSICYFKIQTLRGLYCIASLNEKTFLELTNNGKKVSGVVRGDARVEKIYSWEPIERENVISNIEPGSHHYIGMAEANLDPAPYPVGFLLSKEQLKKEGITEQPTSTEPRSKIIWVGRLLKPQVP